MLKLIKQSFCKHEYKASNLNKNRGLVEYRCQKCKKTMLGIRTYQVYKRETGD